MKSLTFTAWRKPGSILRTVPTNFGTYRYKPNKKGKNTSTDKEKIQPRIVLKKRTVRGIFRFYSRR